MKKRMMLVGVIACFMLVLAACGGGNQASQSGTDSSSTDTAQAEPKNSGNSSSAKASQSREVEYLGEHYTVPEKVERIVITGAMEAMEDAAVLDVHPVGAISIGGTFPDMFAAITDKAQSIGEKQQPNFEKILELKPDVILGSTKFPTEVVENLQKIAPTILVSHISTNWDANLRLMAELTGKQAEAEHILKQYNTDTQAVKASLKEKLQGKKVAALRIRGSQVFVYPKDVYFNPVLYDEMGLEVPEQVIAAKTQEAISTEQLAEMNPDYLFLQFTISEGQDASKVYEDLKQNPIVQQIHAFKEDHVYINVVDPLMEGGPAYSRIKFVESVQQHLDK